MEGRMVDIIEDIGKGITYEQLAQKPKEGEKDSDRTNRTSTRENA